MPKAVRNYVSLTILGLVGIASLAAWFVLSPQRHLLPRLPGEDGETADNAAGAEAVDLQGMFAASGWEPPPRPAPPEGAWPRFRGEHYDNISRENVPLAERWGDDGPEVLWSVDLGDGHAAPAVLNGRVYLLDYDEEARADTLLCLDLETGQELWRRAYQVPVKRNHGMSRTVPAVNEDIVVTIGPKCHVLCTEAETGAFLWGIDLVARYEATVPLWYTAQCPLIDGDVVVLAPGGAALMVGVDARSGDVVWETPNPDGYEMSHASIIPMTLNGRRVYVYPAIGGLAGVAADGPDRGSLLFSTDAWNHAVVAPSPVPLGAGRILVTAGYGVGSMVLDVTPDWAVRVAHTWARTEFACEQQTPILYEDRLYTIMPKDGGELREQLVCMTPEGKTLWTSGKTHRFGLGPFMIADDKILILDDEGVLHLAATGGDAYRELDRAALLDGRDPWGPFALAGGRLFLRDSKQMICVDVARP